MSVAVAWVDAVTELRGQRLLAEEAARDCATRYAEPHRRYHRTSHVEAVLADASRLAVAEKLDARQRAILTLAVCAHDVVYDANPGEDERASAEWARQVLTAAGVDDDAVSTVVALVLTTLTHSVEPNDVVAAVLSDADLAILGSPEAVYDAYTSAVREEFAAIPDEMWSAGRAPRSRTATGEAQALHFADRLRRLGDRRSPEHSAGVAAPPRRGLATRTPAASPQASVAAASPLRVSTGVPGATGVLRRSRPAVQRAGVKVTFSRGLSSWAARQRRADAER